MKTGSGAARTDVSYEPELERPIGGNFFLGHINPELVEQVQIELAANVVHAATVAPASA